MYKNIFLLIFSFVVIFSAQAQLSFRHHYYQTDVSGYKTYRLAAFTINKKEADPGKSTQVSSVQSKLHESLSKNGFEQAENPDLLIFLKLKVDTLGAQLPQNERKELMTNFTIDIRQNPKYEKVFMGTVNGLIVTNDKSENRLQKIYKKFFKDFK
ncbi:DUF4136 domain-containing protein [Reichenbachiella sp.]|uniref:DUF4136 domain-containing protein n=1 Tax=Reichenbachiella sp. TaxID=2184521 RepID=UPI003B5BE492